MKCRYHEDDRMVIPEFIQNMDDKELHDFIEKKEKQMKKSHKKTIKKKNYRTIEEKLMIVGCKLPLA